MVVRRALAGSMVGAFVAAACWVAPALGASESLTQPPPRESTLTRAPGGFTPSAADPKMAALFARGGLDTANFRFTPSDARNSNRAVTVAVRASSAKPARDSVRLASTASAAAVGLAPIAYNLGVGVGWKRFAVSGDLAKVDLGMQPGGREAADVAVSYAGNRFTGQLKASNEHALPGLPEAVTERPSYSLDVGGSFALTRRIDLTAGMRYKSERERLTRVDDERRDSQAVYVGTAFRF